jgi:transcription elongation factor Elf1
MKSTLAHRTMHLREEQLRPSDTTCPFCSSSDRIEAVVLQKDPVVYVLSCKNCHASSASRMPTQETLSAYYSAYYEGKDKEVAIDIPGKLAGHIFNNTFNYCDKKTISILDFGGGNGEIAVRLSEKLIARGTDEVYISLVDYGHPQNPLSNRKIT